MAYVVNDKVCYNSNEEPLRARWFWGSGIGAQGFGLIWGLVQSLGLHNVWFRVWSFQFSFGFLGFRF